MNPVPILCGCSSWSSAIENFIANFCTLDLFVHDFLEDTLSPEDFVRIKERRVTLFSSLCAES